MIAAARSGSRRKTMPFWLSLTNTLPPRRRDVARMECRRRRARCASGCALRVSSADQRAALARLDRRNARRAVGRDPQPLALLIPGDGERVQRRRARSPASGRSSRQARIWRSRMLDTQIVLPSLATPSTRRCLGSIVRTVCGWAAAAAASASRPITGAPRRPVSAACCGSPTTRRHIRAARTSGRRRDSRSRTLPLP